MIKKGWRNQLLFCSDRRSQPSCLWGGCTLVPFVLLVLLHAHLPNWDRQKSMQWRSITYYLTGHSNWRSEVARARKPLKISWSQMSKFAPLPGANSALIEPKQDAVFAAQTHSCSPHSTAHIRPRHQSDVHCCRKAEMGRKYSSSFFFPVNFTSVLCRMLCALLSGLYLTVFLNVFGPHCN